MHAGSHKTSALLLAMTLGACTDATDVEGVDDSSTGAATSGPVGSTSGGEDDDTSDESSGDVPIDAAGHCDYTSPFTQAAECREYTGSSWTADAVQSECDALSGEAALDALCATEGMLGRCVLDGGTDREVRIVSYGDDASTCAGNQNGCENFGGGTWEPEGVCADEDPGDSVDPGPSSPFIQPTLECRDPIEGEPAGQGEGGQVCTWQLISASTEPGRHFEDYGDCDVVYSQRPYYPAPANDLTDDPRMDEPAYVAELDWVREEIQASACVCCHSDSASAGASNWTIDAEGNWVGTFNDSGLAMAAGWIDSSSFGMFDPEDNNGFDRRYGIPSTDPERMRSFFVGELEHRGVSEAEFMDDAPFGGPLYAQLMYEPTACENDERVDRDGTIHWEGGDARYVYVLEAGSANPTVPPNLDLPQGTMWRLDVPWTEAEALHNGEVVYGDVPGPMTQRIPADGSAPDVLSEGETYYLYVLSDVAIPLTRCLFTY